MEKSAKTEEKYKIITVFWALIILLVGGMVYLLFRSTSLPMFDWVRNADMMNSIEKLGFNICLIPAWMIYILPDGLWMFSYCLIIGSIWDFRISRCWFMLTLLLFVAIIFEFLQYIHVIPGTFDNLDIIAYTIAFFLGALYIIITGELIILKNINNETES